MDPLYFPCVGLAIVYLLYNGTKRILNPVTKEALKHERMLPVIEREQPDKKTFLNSTQRLNKIGVSQTGDDEDITINSTVLKKKNPDGTPASTTVMRHGKVMDI